MSRHLRSASASICAPSLSFSILGPQLTFFSLSIARRWPFFATPTSTSIPPNHPATETVSYQLLYRKGHGLTFLLRSFLGIDLSSFSRSAKPAPTAPRRPKQPKGPGHDPDAERGIFDSLAREQREVVAKPEPGSTYKSVSPHYPSQCYLWDSALNDRHIAHA